ncbi:MAG: hypothetical protein HYT78_04495 [Deltaproteobacteria bacterium]|nr:hypothetical protein [Deltaproteobacteria bacterium]
MGFKKLHKLFGLIAIGFAFAAGFGPAFAQEPFYKGKTLRLLVNFTAGGPTDIFARLMARYLSKHIPGTPGVIVENMGGAGGIIGANHVYGAAKPDGLTVGVFSGSHVAQILASSGVRYDLRNMPIIAGAAETSVVVIRADTGVKAPSDLLTLQKPIVVGGLGRESPKDLALRLALDLLGVGHRYVTGYKGVAEIRLAIKQGEVNYSSESLTGYNSAVVPMVREGVVVPLFQEGVLSPDSEIVRDTRSALPSLKEVFVKVRGKEPSGSLWEAYKVLAGANSMLRFIAAPPKTPSEPVQILRGSFRETFEDPEFKAESDRILR